MFDMLNGLMRFPLIDAQRIQAVTALENAKVLEARKRDRDYAMRPFMDRPLSGDQRIVLRWVVASRDQFPNRSNMSREQMNEISKQQCYRK